MNQKILLILILSSIFLASCSIIEMPKDVTGNVVATPVSCADSDGGQTFETAGTATITYSDGTTKIGGRDACVCNKLLREYYCSGRSVAVKTQACNSCVNGACVGGLAPASVACTDTDGGKNLEVYGEMRVCGGAINRDTCAMGNLDNPGDTAVANCDGDGRRCKLQEKYCAADGTGVHENNIVPIGKRCVNGAIVVDPCPPVTNRICSNGDIYESVTRCGVESSNTLITDCQQGCAMSNGQPTCLENCAEEKEYFCRQQGGGIFEITKKCGIEQNRVQLLSSSKCENGRMSFINCNWQTGVGVFRESNSCSDLGCSVNDPARCCDTIRDNLQVVAPAYCDGNTYVNATYIGCNGQQNVPARTDCTSIQVWDSVNRRNSIVPGQCQTIDGFGGCYACGYEYCINGPVAYGGPNPYYNYQQGKDCTPAGTRVNITCA